MAGTPLPVGGDTNVEALDPSRPDLLRALLECDKPERVEGLCAERVFADDLLSPSGLLSSSHWWFYRCGDRLSACKLVTDMTRINDVDTMVTSRLVDRLPVRLAYFDGEQKRFLAYPAPVTSFDSALSLPLRYWKLMPVRRAPQPHDPGAKRGHRDRAICWLEGKGALYDAAIERFFANSMLGVRMQWDIDRFVHCDGTLHAVEVKQKYPTRHGQFGLNKGLARLFARLCELGFDVRHVVLTKPGFTDAIPAVVYLDNGHYRGMSWWLGTAMSSDLPNLPVSIAPSRTSLFGTNTVSYVPLNASRFSFIKVLTDQSPEALVSFFGNRCRRLSGADEIPRCQGSYVTTGRAPEAQR